MNIRARTGTAMSWTAIQGWGGQIIGLIVYALLARYLEPTDFGLVAMAMVFIAFTQIFVEQGLSVALIQRKDITDEHLNTAFWTNVVAGVILSILGMGAAAIVSNIVNQPKLLPVLQAISLTLAINSLVSVQMAIFRRNLNYKPLAYSAFASTVIGGIVGVVMAVNGYGVWSLVGQQIVTRITHVLALWYQSDWRPKLSWRKKEFFHLYQYSINILGINILEYFNRYADNFLIGYFLGLELLGYYTLAYKFYQTLIGLLSGLASGVSFSVLSSIQTNIPKVRSAFYEMNAIMSFVAFPIFIGAGLLAPELFGIVFGPEWEKSVIVFQILMIVCLLESVFLFNGSVMLALGKPNWRLRLNLLNAIVNVIGFSIAVRWGIEYVALAYVLRSYLLSPLPLFLVKKLIQIDYRHYLKQLAPAIFSAVTMGLAITYFTKYVLLTDSDIATVVLSTLLGIAIYLPLSWLINRNPINKIYKTISSMF